MKKPNKRRPDRARYVWIYYFAWRGRREPERMRYLSSTRR